MSNILTQTEQKQETDFFKVLGLLPFLLLGVLLNAYFLLLLWHWFVVPLGVREITYWHSAGLSTIVSYLFHHRTPTNNQEKRDYLYWKDIVQTGFREMAFFFVLALSIHLLMGRQ